jgi:hypothetical protein
VDELALGHPLHTPQERLTPTVSGPLPVPGRLRLDLDDVEQILRGLDQRVKAGQVDHADTEVRQIHSYPRPRARTLSCSSTKNCLAKSKRMSNPEQQA